MTTEPTPAFDAVTEASILVDRLVGCLVGVRIYEIGHSRVQNALADLHQSLARFASDGGATNVVVGVADRVVFCQGRPLVGASIGAPRLLEILTAWAAGGIEFRSPVPREELEQLLRALTTRGETANELLALNGKLAAQGVTHVRVLPPYRDGNEVAEGLCGGSEAAPAPPPIDVELRIGVRFYQTLIDLLQNVTVSVCRGGRIDFAPVQAQAERMLQKLEDGDQTTLGMLRQEQYDAFTFGHSLRVALLAMQFARTMTDDHDLLVRIGTAGLLHDVGKSQVPFELLHATRPLDQEERRLVNRHAELGAEILLDHQDADPLSVAAAFGHHRGPDGTGYPRTAHRHEVSLVTNIIKICDIYEALTAARPYKRAMTPVRAYRVMLAMGSRLDRALMRRFIASNGVYPVGQLVELLDGRLAVVRSQGTDPLRPVVAVVDDPELVHLESGDEMLLDLGDIGCCSAHGILCDLTSDEARERARLVDEATGRH